MKHFPDMSSRRAVRLRTSAIAIFLPLALATCALALTSYGRALPQSTLLFYSTLDDPAALTAPLAGIGTGASAFTVPINDFVPARAGNGVRLHTPGAAEYVRFVQKLGTVQNVELNRGTIDFWYQPSYPHTDGKVHRILLIGALNGAGSILLSKRATANANDLCVELRTNSNAVKRTTVPAAQYLWSAGSWVHLRVTWDGGVATGVQSVRLYVDDTERVYGSKALGPFPMPPESGTKYICLGAGPGTGTANQPNGCYDELAIHSVAMAPQVPAADPIPPTVSLTYPREGDTISNLVALTADARDDYRVAGVRFQVDGVDVAAESTTPPFTASLDTLTLADGAHVATAIARDAFGNETSAAPVDFVIDNLTRPNILLIVTDDQRWDTLQYMPITMARLAQESVVFANGFVTNPLCTPTRATLFTGRYSHDHGVMQNMLPYGGVPLFDDKSTIATLLQKSGYRTALAGKYMNDYYTVSPYVPPGWSDWRAIISAESSSYYNVKLNENGTPIQYDASTQNYSTDLYASKAISFIQSTPPGQPLFLVYATSAPHSPSTPALVDVGSYASMPAWRPPSYDEADVSDKPAWVQALPPISPATSAASDALHSSMVECLQSVDRNIDRMIDELEATGRWGNTYVIFLSDNGMSWGEHRWVDRKVCPYEESQRIPFLIRKPGLTGRVDDSFVLDIDVFSTCAELAGAAPVPGTKGLSLVGLLDAPGSLPRTEVLFESQHTTAVNGEYQAVRTAQFMYAEYFNGDRELYDLSIDPFELTNVFDDPNYAAVLPDLQALLAVVKNS